jgi:hypothetical protein
MAEDISYLDPGVGSTLPTATTSRSGSSGGFDWANAGAGTYASAFGTVLSTVGSLMAARSAKRAASYNAQVISRNAQSQADALEMEAAQRDRNAAIILQDIFLSRQAQEQQEQTQRDQQEYIAGQTQAIIGASGLLMRGSPLAVYEANLQHSERQILAGRYKADLQERALRDQATMEGYAADVARYGAGERLRVGAGQARLAQYSGSQQAAASTMGAFSGLLSGGARTYAEYQKTQALKGPVLKE